MAKGSKPKKLGGGRTPAMHTTHPAKRKKGPDAMRQKGKGTKGDGRTSGY